MLLPSNCFLHQFLSLIVVGTIIVLALSPLQYVHIWKRSGVPFQHIILPAMYEQIYFPTNPSQQIPMPKESESNSSTGYSENSKNGISFTIWGGIFYNILAQARPSLLSPYMQNKSPLSEALLLFLEWTLLCMSFFCDHAF